AIHHWRPKSLVAATRTFCPRRHAQPLVSTSRPIQRLSANSECSRTGKLGAQRRRAPRLLATSPIGIGTFCLRRGFLLGARYISCPGPAATVLSRRPLQRPIRHALGCNSIHSMKKCRMSKIGRRSVFLALTFLFATTVSTQTTRHDAEK